MVDHRGRRRRADDADGGSHPGARRARSSGATRRPCCSTRATRMRRRGPARRSSSAASSTAGPRPSCATGTRSRTDTPRRPCQAVDRLAPARVSGGVGQARRPGGQSPGADAGRPDDPGLEPRRACATIPWSPSASTGWTGRRSTRTPIATLVSFACHPVVIGPDYPGAGPDFVGALCGRPSRASARGQAP